MGTKIKSKFWSRRRVYERFQFIANLVTLISFIYIAVVPISSAKAVVTVNLNNAPQSMGYGTGSTCPRDPNVYGSYTDDVWHLVASQGNFLDASGNILGAVGTWNVPNIYRGMMKDTSKPAQLWMYTQHIDGVTTIMTGGTAILTDGGTKFVISHTCPGLTSNTLLTTPTSNQTFYPSTLPTTINTASSLSTLTLGNTVSDNAVINVGSGTAAPTGSVSFYYCFNSTTAISSCTSTTNLIKTVTTFVSAGSGNYTVSSGNFTPPTAGYYSFYATYSGDGNYTGSSETSVSGETFTVTGPPTRASPTVATRASVTTLQVGSSLTDSVTVSGSNGTPTGTVTFSYCYSSSSYNWTANACGSDVDTATTDVQVGTPVTLSGSGTATSASFAPANAGNYIFHAVYSGDTNYLAGSDPGTNETFTVSAAAVLPTSTVVTTASSNSIMLGGSVTDTATITVFTANGTPTGATTFYYCTDSGANPVPTPLTSCNASTSPILIGSSSTYTATSSTTFTVVSPAFYPSAQSNYAFFAVYAGDSKYQGSADTSVTNETFGVTAGDSRASTTVTTTPSATTLKLGAIVTDTATVTATSGTPTGTVTFSYCYSANSYTWAANTCGTTTSDTRTTSTQIGAPVTISGGRAVSLSTWAPPAVGYYSFHAVYSGDTSYKGNFDSGAGETFVVTALPVPAVTTQVSTANVNLGGSLTDVATITLPAGSTTAPTGNVKFYYCYSATSASAVTNCSSTTNLAGTQTSFVQVGSNYTATSPAFFPPSAGYYAFYAVYSGDSNYATAAETSTTNETFRVWPATGTPTITTSTDTSTVVVGGSRTDTATITGDGFHTPTGTVTFSYCKSTTSFAAIGACTSGGTQLGAPVAVSGGRAVSTSLTPTDTQTTYYKFHAVYSGDSYYASAEDSGTNETFTVTPLSAATVTTTASTSNLDFGSSLTDTARINAPSGAPTGTVTFYYCYSATTSVGSCNSTSNLVGTSSTFTSMGSNNYDVVSPSFTPPAVGYYAFYAVYGGNATYSAVGDTSVTNETFQVWPTSGTPTVATRASVSTIAVGQGLTDTVTVTGDGYHSVSGSVIFYYCYSAVSYNWVTNPCSTTGSGARLATQFGAPVTLSGGNATSTTFTPANVGYYTFLAVYSGDSYYNVGADAGTNENFQATSLATTSITTQRSASSISLGGSINDVATIYDTATVPTGSISFYYCTYTVSTTIADCNTNKQLIGTVNSPFTAVGSNYSAISPDFYPTSSGTYAFYVTYSGDASTAASAATSFANETFTVTSSAPTAVTVVTRVSSASVGAGVSVTDSVTVTGNAPTGSVIFTYCTSNSSFTLNSPCTNGTQIGLPKTLSGGNATSDAFTPTATSSTTYYILHAAYSGDSLNLSGSDGGTNETLTVAALASTTISTTNSSSSFTLGNSVIDTATITSATNVPTGTVNFYYCSYTASTTIADCSAAPTLVGTVTSPFTSIGSNQYRAVLSPAFVPSATGTYAFYVTYSGDTQTAGSNATSFTSETFTVNAAAGGKSSPTFGTSVSNSSPSFGQTVTDTATVTWDGTNPPTGTVTFHYCYSATSYSWTTAGQSCVVGGSGARSARQFGSPVALASTSPYRAVSSTFTPPSFGYYTFMATYSGDSNYNSVSDNGSGENFSFIDPQAAKTASTITTQLRTAANCGGSAITTSQPVNTSIYDCVTFNGNGSLNNSAPVYFTYCYSAISFADATPCVNGTSFSAGTTIGGGGASRTTSSSVFAPQVPGYYVFHAILQGDSSATGAVDNGVNETLTVSASALRSPTVTTSVSSSSINLGSSVTDSVTINVSGAAPTGTISFYVCSYSAGMSIATCVSNSTKVAETTTITSVGGNNYNVRSPAYFPSATGTYAFYALYNGDVNTSYAGDTSFTNETFTVNSTGNPTPTVTSTVSKSNISSGGSVTDTATVSGSVGTPTGTVTFSYCSSTVSFADIGTCTNGTQIGSPVALSSGQAVSSVFTPPTASVTTYYMLHAVYSGNSSYLTSYDNGTNETFTVTPLTLPSITTRASASNLNLGSSLTDLETITLSSSGTAPTGTVSFYYCYSAVSAITSCTSTANLVGTTTTITSVSGTVYTATSPAFYPPLAGYYAFYATYGGDSNYAAANASDVTNETFRVWPAVGTPTITTSTNNSSVVTGGTRTDTATITGDGYHTPTGTVTFTYCKSYVSFASIGACTSGGTQLGSPVTVSAGSAVSSVYTTSETQTTYVKFHAVYSGDSYYSSAYDDGTNETFTITALPTSTLVTTSSKSSFTIGSSVYDSATITVSSANGTPTGKVSFYYCFDASNASNVNPCTSTSNLVGETTTFTTVSSTVFRAISPTFTPPATGNYAFHAVYDGDSKYQGSTETSTTNETFTVTAVPVKPTPIVTTTRGATSSILSGRSITDTATVTGSSGTPTGTVTFYYCTSTSYYDWTLAGQSCVLGGSDTRSATQVGTAVTLNGSGVAVSSTFTPPTTSSTVYYTFNAVYSGDGTYLTATDTGTSENFTVEPLPTPTVSTTNSSSSLILGNSILDTATITTDGSAVPTGSVNFYVCAYTDGVTTITSCASSGTLIGTTNSPFTSIGSNQYTAVLSPAYVPNSAGTYAFYATYSGDSNFQSAHDTSFTNETFTAAAFVRGTPTISTTAGSSPIKINKKITDTATVTGSGSTPTGTVTFTYCVSNSAFTLNSPCTNGTQFGDPIELNGSGVAVSDEFTPPSTGYYIFNATYNGDSNYVAASDNGLHETFTVEALPTTSITTTRSSASFELGGSVTDTATIVTSDGGAPTGTVNFYYCFHSDAAVTSCTDTSNLISTNAVVSGAGGTYIAVSDSFIPSKEGYYAFAAVYSGDSTYSGSSETSTTNEDFNVISLQRRSKPVVTSLRSDTTIIVGQPIYDTATVVGTTISGTPTLPTGTVTFFYCYDAVTAITTCATTGTQTGGSVSLSGSGVTATASSEAFYPTLPGYYVFQAQYSGDINYEDGFDTSTVLEAFQVVPKTTTYLNTTASAATIVSGTSISDTATITLASSASGAPTGTVNFYYCYSATVAFGPCTSTANLISSKTTFTGSGTTYTVNSGSFFPSRVGYYAFYSTYSGDGNYLSSVETSTSGETFNVVPDRGTPTVTSNDGATSIRIGQSILDTATISGDGLHIPTGTVTFSYCFSGVSFAAIGSCTNGTQIGGAETITATAPYTSTMSAGFTPTNVGYYIFHATYSGDTYYNSAEDNGLNETFTVLPKISTSLTTAASYRSFPIGGPNTDVATISLPVGSTIAPTGNVKFYYCYNASTFPATCTSTSNLVGTTNSPFTGSGISYTATSPSFIPTQIGKYAFYAVYSGDANYSGSAGLSVSGETFTVTTADRETATVTTTAGATVINYGDSITDTATVIATGNGVASGTVTFSYCYSASSYNWVTNPCSLTGTGAQAATQIGAPVALSGSTSPYVVVSPSFTPSYGGYYTFHATYSGDTHYTNADDLGTGETFTMIATSPTTVTTTSSLSSLYIGSSVSDTATINIGSKTTSPTGNVKFYYCYKSDTSTPIASCNDSNATGLVSTVYSFTYSSAGNYTVNSGSFIPANVGLYAFYALYSGDGNYTGSGDTSLAGETFTVNVKARAPSTVTTQVNNTSIVFGQGVKDVATVTTGATGTVTFSYCYSADSFDAIGSCLSGTQFGTPVTIDTATNKATSITFVPNRVGYYKLHAVYSGNADLESSYDNGTNETFQVTAYPSTISTKASVSTLNLGQTITDVATISIGGGTVDPTGSVKFYYCVDTNTAPTSCSATTGTIFDTQTTFAVNADGTGYVATSRAFTPATVGYYMFHAKYSGDGTYGSADDLGTNESFRVYGNLPSTTRTQVSATNLNFGDSVTDVATITGDGSNQVTGTVTFSYCYSLTAITTCSSGTQLGSAVTVTASGKNGTATSSTFTPTRAGYYVFRAVYSGDSYYVSSVDNGVNETFTVAGRSTSLTTVSSTASLNLGSTISDMATLNIGSGTTAPTGNVKFYYCYNASSAISSCSSTTNYIGQSTTFTNTSGSYYTINSPVFTPNDIGFYAFYAVYSGDANYAGSADTDLTWEKFEVKSGITRESATVTTQVSSSTITLGQSITDIATVVGNGTIAPTGSIQFSYCYSLSLITTCSGATTDIGSPVTLSATAPYRVQSPTFTPTASGYYVFKATYSGSTKYNIATDDGTNENFYVANPITTSITTAASLSTFALGVSNTDVVTLDIGAGTAIPSGTVTFYYCYDASTVITSCSSTDNRVGSSTTFEYVSGSTYRVTSPIFTPTQVGNYVYYAVYSGDSNYTSATDGSTTTEAFTVTDPEARVTPTIATTASKSTLSIGGSLTDAVTVTGDGSNIPTGTVTFYYCFSASAIGSCATANATQIGDPVILDGTGKATSPVFTPANGGYYKFHAVYSGDTNYKDAYDPSAASEAFVVNAHVTYISTVASASTLELGSTVTDIATIDVGDGEIAPTGNVNFYYCYSSDTSTPIATCGETSTTTGIGRTTTFNHTVGSLYTVTSPTFTPPYAGNYAFYAVYSGDTTYFASSDTSTSQEVFTVTTPTGGDLRSVSNVYTVASSSTINLGESVHDSATVSSGTFGGLTIAGSGPVAYEVGDPSRPVTGTLTWYYCYNPSSVMSGCNSSIGTQFSDPIPVGASASSVQSPSFTPEVAGYYAFHAVYSGDGNYMMSYDPSGISEQFLVMGSTPPGGGGGGTPPGGSRGPIYNPPSTPDKSPEKPGKPGKTSIQGDIPSLIQTGFAKLTNTSGSPTPVASAPATTPKASATPKPTKKVTTAKAKPIPTKTFKFPVAPITNTKFDPKKCNIPMGKSRTAGLVQYRGHNVRVVPVTYPKGGKLVPPPYTDIAAISVRHQPISATEGSTLIVWHVDWNNCIGQLDALSYSHIGDNFSIVDENGVSHSLRVVQNFNVPKGKYRSDWFMMTGKRQFVFVTCAGQVVNHHYLENKFIIAVPN